MLFARPNVKLANFIDIAREAMAHPKKGDPFFCEYQFKDGVSLVCLPNIFTTDAAQYQESLIVASGGYFSKFHADRPAIANDESRLC